MEQSDHSAKNRLPGSRNSNSSPAGDSEAPDQFNLVTLNAFGVPLRRTRTRLRTIARELNDRQLDAVCLQEVQWHRYAPLLFDAFTEFPYGAWERHIYAPKGGLMTLTRRAHQRTTFIPFAERGRLFDLTLPDRLLHKGMLLCEIVHRGLPISIINTHLVANYSGNWNRNNRYARVEAAQLAQLAEVVQAQPPERVVIVAGDFNVPRASWLYEEFLERAGLVDPLAHASVPTYRPSPLLPPLFAERLRAAIDYTLVRIPSTVRMTVRGVVILRDEVRHDDGRRRYLSDHNAIHLRLEWSPSPDDVLPGAPSPNGSGQ